MRNWKGFGLGVAVVAALSLAAIAQAPRQNIVEIAAGNKDFSTLVSLVKSAGLVEALSGKGPFTVFAPTNEAFEKLPKATLDAVAGNKELLTRVLKFHVVKGNVMAADAVKLNGKEVETLSGDKFRITVRDGKVFVNDAQVVKTDIRATNGVIHVIDRVIVPPTDARGDLIVNKDGSVAQGCSGCGGK